VLHLFQQVCEEPAACAFRIMEVAYSSITLLSEHMRHTSHRPQLLILSRVRSGHRQSLDWSFDSSTVYTTALTKCFQFAAS
jgi:hypothetical protein